LTLPRAAADTPAHEQGNERRPRQQPSPAAPPPRHGRPAGRPGRPPKPEDEHDYAPWEKRVDAILRLLADSKRRLISTDELRRGIEELGPGAYDEMSYYERWIASITNNLVEKGVITVDELGRRMAQVAAAWPAGAEAPARPVAERKP
jgi:hypothetical protein